MMSLKEKVAYLKGLAEGLGLDSESKEGKLMMVIIDTLSDMAEEIEELNENALDIGEELDALSGDLSDVEDILYGEEDDDDDFDDFDDDDYDDDDECGCEFCNHGDISYDVECPSCGVEIHLTESDLLNESISCTSCGELLEFDFEDDEDEDDEDEDDEDDEED